MALHFDLQVNTETIGTFYARRLHETCAEINAYEWKVVENGETFEGTLRHRFADGAWVLVQVILEDIWRQKQERTAYGLEA